MTICEALGITKFSLLAHSAGAIYALATALRMPNQIRGRVHLLAPWIPPSQMSPVGLHVDTTPPGQLPKSQRILRVLPTTFLKVANSSFMSATSASVTRSVPKSPQRSKRRSQAAAAGSNANRRESFMMMDRVQPNSAGSEPLGSGDANGMSPIMGNENESTPQPQLLGPVQSGGDNRASAGSDDAVNRAAVAAAMALAEEERRREYEARLTMAIWDAATTNAYPAVDLIVCLERTQPIGFRYVDVTRPVVIHHGARDTRVPVDNVKWLGRTMRKCEVRILEGEGHGLMASAVVMGNVLTEIAQEWETWNTLTKKP
jgi:pimeloyl-ACP methyl ester carboxylesterase